MKNNNHIRHYKIEKELAKRLRNASTDQRTSRLYSQVYEDLFLKIPDHPQLLRKLSDIEKKNIVANKFSFISDFIQPEDLFVELGAGDCSFSIAVAKKVRSVCAIDISYCITGNLDTPENFNLIISDATKISLTSNLANLIFSDQFVEHLHPEDAINHFKEVYRILCNKGYYVCLTPHRFSGPHDISVYFDDVATGLHLKEYSNAEIENLMRQVGFTNIRTIVKYKSKTIIFPIKLINWIEKVVAKLPVHIRRKVARLPILRNFLGISIIGQKNYFIQKKDK